MLLSTRPARKLEMLHCSHFPRVTLGAEQSPTVGGTNPAPGSWDSSGAGLIYTCSCSPWPRGQEPRRDERARKCRLSCFGNEPICHLGCKAEQKNIS